MHRQALSLLSLAMLTGLLACNRCSEGTESRLGDLPSKLAATAPPSGENGDVHSSPDDEHGDDSVDTRLFEYAGDVDASNRYASTVMVETHEQLVKAHCSGVLIEPRLVLTAAHCVCMQREEGAAQGKRGTLMDSSACATQVTIKTVVYEPARGARRPAMVVQSYEGVVRPHPEFKLLLDDQGTAILNSADLAVIFLEEPVSSISPDLSMAKFEAQASESLIMAGYGTDSILGSVYGIRYFRRNSVSEPSVLTGGRVPYAQQGPYTYNGFEGGPCIREDDQDRQLVGIASVGTDNELWFTSTYFHRAWLLAEVLRSRGTGAPQKAH